MQLKGFTKISLQPGAVSTVAFDLKPRECHLLPWPERSRHTQLNDLPHTDFCAVGMSPPTSKQPAHPTSGCLAARCRRFLHLGRGQPRVGAGQRAIWRGRGGVVARHSRDGLAEPLTALFSRDVASGAVTETAVPWSYFLLSEINTSDGSVILPADTTRGHHALPDHEIR